MNAVISAVPVSGDDKPMANRPAWARDENVISVRMDGWSRSRATEALHIDAEARGLKVAEIAFVSVDKADVAYARLAQ